MSKPCLPCHECKGKIAHSITCSRLAGHVAREFGRPCGPGNCDTKRTT